MAKRLYRICVPVFVALLFATLICVGGISAAQVGKDRTRGRQPPKPTPSAAPLRVLVVGPVAVPLGTKTSPLFVAPAAEDASAKQLVFQTSRLVWATFAASFVALLVGVLPGVLERRRREMERAEDAKRARAASQRSITIGAWIISERLDRLKSANARDFALASYAADSALVATIVQQISSPSTMRPLSEEETQLIYAAFGDAIDVLTTARGVADQMLPADRHTADDAGAIATEGASAAEHRRRSGVRESISDVRARAGAALGNLDRVRTLLGDTRDRVAERLTDRNAVRF